MSWKRIFNMFESYKKDLKLDTMPVLTAKRIKSMFPKLREGFHFGDISYNTTTKPEMQKLLKHWIFKYFKWTKRRDCDNFAELFNGLAKWFYPTQAIGIIWVEWDEKNPDTGFIEVKGHALNFFVYYDEKSKMFEWNYIEPQTGEILETTKVLNWKPFFVKI